MDVPAGSCRRIAVLVPCRNEVATVAGVVAGFRAALPACDVDRKSVV